MVRLGINKNIVALKNPARGRAWFARPL